jgi:electron transport complex protein RnfB
MTANARAIDDLLPQTQCTRCGYQGCLPYAEAVVSGEAGINQCPPGGAATIEHLAALTGQPATPLNPANGIEAPPTVAQIDEARCIGCAKCLPPCPVDCIVMVPRASVPGASADLPPPTASRERYQAHTARVARRAAERAQKLAAKKLAARHPS